MDHVTFLPKELQRHQVLSKSQHSYQDLQPLSWSWSSSSPTLSSYSSPCSITIFYISFLIIQICLISRSICAPASDAHMTHSLCIGIYANLITLRTFLDISSKTKTFPQLLLLQSLALFLLPLLILNTIHVSFQLKIIYTFLVISVFSASSTVPDTVCVEWMNYSKLQWSLLPPNFSSSKYVHISFIWNVIIVCPFVTIHEKVSWDSQFNYTCIISRERMKMYFYQQPPCWVQRWSQRWMDRWMNEWEIHQMVQ